MVLNLCSEFDHMLVWKRIRKAGSTKLFQQTPEYFRWKESMASSTLVYTGKLGAGKSVILANIVDDLFLHSESHKTAVAFFFCRHDIAESLKARTAIGSLARQLLIQAPDLDMIAERFPEANTMKGLTGILALLREAIPPHRKILCVIDGLDEMSDSERELLVGELGELQKSLNMVLCISLRQDSNAPLRIESDRLLNTHIAPLPENESEIEEFIVNELEARIITRRLVVGDLQLLLEIKKALLAGSDGMFLWVTLQIESLCDMETDKAIREALADLPRGLSETFRRVLLKSDNLNHNHQRAILELMLVACRPLTLEEIREALSVNPGETTWNESHLINDVQKVLGCCGCLIITDEEDQTLHLAHHSVKQYLLGESYDSLGQCITTTSAHMRIFNIIVTYLNYSVFDRQLSKIVLPQVMSRPALVEIMRSTPFSSNRFNKIALKLLRSKTNSDFNLAQTLADARKDFHGSSEKFTFRQYAMIYWSCHVFEALPLPVEIGCLFTRLFQPESLTPITMDQDQQDLLLIRAIEANCMTVACLMVNSNDFDVNRILDDKLRTVLHLAAANGSEEMTRLILQCNGIYECVPDLNNFTPLGLAIRRHNFEIVKSLLLSGHIDDRHIGIISFLEQTATSNSEDFESFFLKNSLQMMPSNAFRCLVYSATYQARLDLVTFFVELNKPPGYYWIAFYHSFNPLLLAIKLGEVDIATRFIESGKIDLHGVNTEGHNVLYHALSWKCEAIAAF